jgi:hypothetical protein
MGSMAETRDRINRIYRILTGEAPAMEISNICILIILLILSKAKPG